MTSNTAQWGVAWLRSCCVVDSESSQLKVIRNQRSPSEIGFHWQNTYYIHTRFHLCKKCKVWSCRSTISCIVYVSVELRIVSEAFYSGPEGSGHLIRLAITAKGPYASPSRGITNQLHPWTHNAQEGISAFLTITSHISEVEHPSLKTGDSAKQTQDAQKDSSLVSRA